MNQLVLVYRYNVTKFNVKFNDKISMRMYISKYVYVNAP